MIPKTHISFSEEELNSFLKTAGIICLAVLTLFILVKTVNEVKTYSTIGDSKVGDVQNTIMVTGKADMDVKPDITVFSWTTDSTGKTAEESSSKVTIVANKALEYLRANGVSNNDLKSGGVVTSTHYENKVVPCEITSKTVKKVSEPASGMAVASMPVIVQSCGGTQYVPSGYESSETVTVKVRGVNTDPSKTGKLVAGLSSIGVKVSGVSNTVDNPDAYEAQVRGQAIAKAQEKARLLASQLGVKLGKVVSFNENAYPYPMMYKTMSARSVESADAAPVPDMPTGTNNISSEVMITYQIK
jgi:uncharacterized protein YggE